MRNSFKRRIQKLENKRRLNLDSENATTESILWDIARGSESPATSVAAIKELRRGQAIEPDKVADNRSWDQVKADVEQLISECLDLMECN